MKYKTNLIILDAAQWNGTPFSLSQIQQLASPNPERIKVVSQVKNGVLTYTFMQIMSGGNVQFVNNTDWVVSGYDGSLFVLPNSIFQILTSKAE
jgi:hypothetical protein